MGIVYDCIAMAGTPLDVAPLVAHSTAPAVAAVGVSYGEAELVDAGRALVAPAFSLTPRGRLMPYRCAGGCGDLPRTAVGRLSYWPLSRRP